MERLATSEVRSLILLLIPFYRHFGSCCFLFFFQFFLLLFLALVPSFSYLLSFNKSFFSFCCCLCPFSILFIWLSFSHLSCFYLGLNPIFGVAFHHMLSSFHFVISIVVSVNNKKDGRLIKTRYFDVGLVEFAIWCP